jgi:hypothetical protein
MGLWDMIAIIAVAGVIGEVFKSVYNKRRSVSKGELTEIRDSISKMQADLDEIKADMSSIVIQLDDLKLNK